MNNEYHFYKLISNVLLVLRNFGAIIILNDIQLNNSKLFDKNRSEEFF